MTETNNEGQEQDRQRRIGQILIDKLGTDQEGYTEGHSDNMKLCYKHCTHKW